MRLNARQIAELAGELRVHSNEEKLRLIAADIGLILDDSGGDSAHMLAIKLITASNTEFPPRDAELLEAIHGRGNARLKAVVDKLRRPGFFAPPDAAGDMDPHEAILLGPVAFVNRSDLRESLRKFTYPDAYSTRVLIVRGTEPCGKSYTWEFLRHLATATVGAIPQWLPLKEGYKTPHDFMAAVFGLIGLDPARLPALPDDPQQARSITPLINAFQGQLPSMSDKWFWLVIDDLNVPGVTPEVRETAFAVAQVVEKTKPNHLWVVLLGYNAPLDDQNLRYVAQEDARFPDPECVADHLCWIADQSPKPLTRERAQEIADLLFDQYQPLDKAAMEKLTPKLEEMGAKLRMGEQP